MTTPDSVMTALREIMEIPYPEDQNRTFKMKPGAEDEVSETPRVLRGERESSEVVLALEELFEIEDERSKEERLALDLKKKEEAARALEVLRERENERARIAAERELSETARVKNEEEKRLIDSANFALRQEVYSYLTSLPNEIRSTYEQLPEKHLDIALRLLRCANFLAQVTDIRVKSISNAINTLVGGRRPLGAQELHLSDKSAFDHCVKELWKLADELQKSGEYLSKAQSKP
jgi:phage terminase Nu1 subunit (DNA packaging protein)